MPPAPAVTNPSTPARNGTSNIRTAPDGYLGVRHATCNLRDGANKSNGKRAPRSFVQQPYRWSERWSDDPPIGTIVLGHDRVIYLGNGDWQSLDDITTPTH